MASTTGIATYSWPARDEFVNRNGDLHAMEQWWDSPTRDSLALLGRRRVGKSWLFRAFAHDKPAIILVADRVVTGTQMARFAEQLEPLLGVRPDLPDVASLLRTLYRLGSERKLLAVIDEFPYLLPDGTAREQVLTEIQAVMEDERESSRTKLALCGSLIGQMESLLAEKSPISGRLRRLDIWPMTFGEARPLMRHEEPPAARVERYAVTGGMARHLAELGDDAPVRDLVCGRVLNRRGPLFDDPRSVLEQELRAPATYFSILEELADNAAQLEHLSKALGVAGKQLTPYLDTLREMRLISASLPVGAPKDARTRKFRIDDGFIRFWFRFVFPNQESLQAGLRPDDLWDGDIAVHLSDHVSPTFEDLCVRWTRLRYGAEAQSVGGWWGNALNAHRQAGTRTTEEVDVVGTYRKQLRIVGECKWTDPPMHQSVLNDLQTFKLPAIEQEKRLKIPKAGPRVLLFSKSGFSTDLAAAAEKDEQVTLVPVEQVVNDLEVAGQ
ncbi:MAG TPA: ATP-binding protein [Thermoleophilaceae bacterium]|nr:ATP-binding protein [Thermoleophilaceae bacterium]